MLMLTCLSQSSAVLCVLGLIYLFKIIGSALYAQANPVVAYSFGWCLTSHQHKSFICEGLPTEGNRLRMSRIMNEK